MSDRSQPVVLITGASAGVGAAAALMLAERGWHVVATGRSEAKLRAVAERVRRAAGVELECHVADFAQLADVRRLAGAVADRHQRLDALANNAGLVASRRRTLTVDGHELTFQVNHLAPYLLTRLLLDSLGPDSRVVTTASAAHRGGQLDLSDLDFTRRRWSAWRAYAASKQANILFTLELARRLEPRGAAATCFHPGLVRSDLGRSRPTFNLVTWLPGAVSAETGGRRLVHLVSSPDGAAHSGAYFVGNRPGTPTRPARDVELAARLWSVSAPLVGLGLGRVS